MPKYRRPLNNKQLRVLIVLFKFKFATIDLLCSANLANSASVMHGRLKVLQDQGYIGRHYTNRDKIDRKPAIYYARPAAINALKKHTTLNKAALNSMYKDKLASPAFMARCLLIFAIHNRFGLAFGGQALDFHSKREMARYDFFPRPLPDAYVTIKHKVPADSQYFMELFEASAPFFAHRRVLKKYLHHYESGEWEYEKDKDYPALLLVCETKLLERRIQRLANWLQTSSGTYFSIYTTHYEALHNIQSLKDKIWTDIDQAQELVTIDHKQATP